MSHRFYETVYGFLSLLKLVLTGHFARRYRNFITLRAGSNRKHRSCSKSGLNTRWMIVEDVPVAVVSAVVNQQTLILVAGGLVIMAAVIISLLIAVRLFIQKPIGSLLKEVGRLSEGDFEQPVAGQERKDEVGALATSLDVFRHRLAEGRSLEAVAERQRLAAE